MVSGFPYGPPTFVILIAATMPSLAAPKQDAFSRSTTSANRVTFVIREAGGEFAIMAARQPEPLARPTTVPIGQSIEIDAALFSLKSRTLEQRP